MTECNREPLLFSSLKSQKIVADFDGGQLTSDGGGLLLREADRVVGLTRRLAACLVDPRDPARIIHDQQTILPVGLANQIFQTVNPNCFLALLDSIIGRGAYGDVICLNLQMIQYLLDSDSHRGAATPDPDNETGSETAFENPDAEFIRIHQKVLSGKISFGNLHQSAGSFH